MWNVFFFGDFLKIILPNKFYAYMACCVRKLSKICVERIWFEGKALVNTSLLEILAQNGIPAFLLDCF